MKPKVFIGTIELVISMVKTLYIILAKAFFRETIGSLKPLKTTGLRGRK